jgi:hypothetical protein
MKSIKIILVLFISFLCFTVNAQEKQEIKKPSEGKALVYIIRPSNFAFLVGFKVFNNDKYLAKLGAEKYLVYECEPGEQLFWAEAENYDFVKANLEANKTYVLLLVPKMGAFKAAVGLKACSPVDKDQRIAFYNAVKNSKEYVFTEESVKDIDEKKSIQSGLKKYVKVRGSDPDRIMALTADMNFLNADKPE